MSKKPFPSLPLLFLIVASVLAGPSPLRAGKTEDCRGALATLLRMPGNDPRLRAFDVRPWPGTTTMGFDVALPETSFRLAAFHARGQSKTGYAHDTASLGTSWHLVMALDEESRGDAFVASLVGDLSEWLGTPRFRNLLIILSEKDGKAQLGKLPPWLKDALMPFADADSYFRPRKTLSLKMGVNFFGTIQRGSAEALQTLERIVLLGGKPESETWAVQGSVSAEIFSKLLAAKMDGSIRAAADRISGAGQGSGSRVKDQFTNLPDRAKEQAAKIPGTPGKAAEKVKDAVTGAGKIPGKVVDGAKKVGQKVKDTAQTVKNKIPGVGESDPDDDRSKTQKIKDGVASAGGKVKGLGQDALDAAKKVNANLRGAYVKVYFPAVTPLPFCELDAAATKKVFYQTLSPSAIQIERDRTEKAWTLIGSRAAKVWILNHEYEIANDLSITYSKEDGKRSFHVVNRGSLDISHTPLRFLSGLVEIDELHMLGELQLQKLTREAKKTAGKSHVAHQDVNVFMGAKGNLGTLHDMDMTLNVAVAHEKGETGIREFGFSLTGDLPLAKLPLLDHVPLVDEIVMKEASVGVGLGLGGGPKAYLAGALDWKGFQGEAALLVETIDDVPQFLFLTRQKDFSLRHVLEACPSSARPPLTDGIFDKGLDLFDDLAMPEMVLMLSSIGGKKGAKGKGHALELKDMPDRIQHLFDGIVSESEGKIPLTDDGISLIGAWDLKAVNQLVHCDLLTKVFDDMGVGKEFKRLALNSPLVVAGSVGGFRSGTLRAGIYVQLPELKFPGQGPLERLIQFDSATQSFFLRLDLASFAIQCGLRGEMKIDLPQLDDKDDKDETALGGELYLNIDPEGSGLHVGAYRAGEWRNPMGLGNIAFTDTAMMFGIDTDMALEMGLGGGLILDLPDGKSMFPNPFAPAENLHHVKQMLDGKTKDAVSESIHADEGHVARLKYGFGAVLGIMFLDELVVPNKLAFYYQADRIGLLWLMDYYDTLLKGVLTGPAANGILTQAGKVMDKDGYKAFRFAFDAYKNQPSIVELFQVDKLPLGVMEYDDLLLQFATPGASLPGFPDINGLGFKIRGKAYVVMFGRHEITGMECRLNLTDGLFVAGELGDLNLGFFSFENAKTELRMGIPGLQDKCHFLIQGDTRFLADKCHAMMEIRPLGLSIELERDLKPFLDVKFTLENDVKLEKLLTQPADMVDFTVRGELDHKSLQRILKDAIVDGMMKGVNDDLSKAEDGLKRAKNDVLSWKNKVKQERIDARRRMLAARKATRKAMDDARHGMDHLMDKARDKAKSTGSKLAKALHLDSLGIGKLLGFLSDAEKHSYNCFKSTVDNAAKGLIGGAKALDDHFDVPVELDPKVKWTEGKYYASLAALETAYHVVHAAHLANDTGKNALNAVLTNRFLQEPVEIRKFLIEATSHKSGRFTVSADLTALGKKFAFDFAVTAAELEHGGAVIVDRLIEKIVPGADSPCQTLLKDLNERCHKETTSSFDGKNPPDEYRLDDDGGRILDAIAIQNECGTRSCPAIPANSQAYLARFSQNRAQWVQTDESHIGGRDYGMDFILFDLSPGNGGVCQKDDVAILAPNNRWLSARSDGRLDCKELTVRGDERLEVWNKNFGGKVWRQGATFFLHTCHNRQIQCNFDHGKVVDAGSENLGPWELITLTKFEKLDGYSWRNPRVWDFVHRKKIAAEEAERKKKEAATRAAQAKAEAEAEDRARQLEKQAAAEAHRKLVDILAGMGPEAFEAALAQEPADRRAALRQEVIARRKETGKKKLDGIRTWHGGHPGFGGKGNPLYGVPGFRPGF